MKTTIHLVAAIAVVSSITGCATPYLTDRLHDAADIFTVTVGKGGGVTARVSPVHAGLFGGVDHVGIRGGEFWTDWNRGESVWWKDYAGYTLDPLILLPGGDGVCFAEDDFSNGSIARGKKYIGRGVCPFVVLPGKDFRNYNHFNIDTRPAYFFTQVEVAGVSTIPSASDSTPGSFSTSSSDGLPSISITTIVRG